MKWKRKTLKRDLYTCQCCGCKENLTVHHINPRSLYDELKAEPSNLVTLCQRCHQYLHDVICMEDINACNYETLMILYATLGTKEGKKIRKKTKNRKW